MTFEAGKTERIYALQVSAYPMVGGIADTQRASSAATLDSMASSSSSDSWSTEDSEVSSRREGDNIVPFVGEVVLSVVETRDTEQPKDTGVS